MRIQLPVETWIEVLDWLRRRDLIKKLDKLWDREFTPIVQDWLHKYTRNVKIGELSITNDGLSVLSCEEWEKVPFAEVELPGNITSFQHITISYLDSILLAFLHRMSPLFQNNNIQLVVYMNANELPIQTALRFLMPMTSSIESVALDYKFLQFLSTNYPSTLSNAKLLSICGTQVSDEIQQMLLDWLFTKRDDGHARILLFGSISGFCEKIPERFLDSARQNACPFFVRIVISYAYADFLLPINIPNAENVRTGEQLTFKNVRHGNWHYRLITNCPKNTNTEWLNKKTEEVLGGNVWDKQQIISLEYLQISPQLYAAEDGADRQQANGGGNKLI